MEKILAECLAIAGIIGTLMLLKNIFRIDPAKEAAAFAARQRSQIEPLERRTLVVDNPNLEGVAIENIPGRAETGVAVSRIRRARETEVRAATGGTVIGAGDCLLAVGTRARLDQFQRVVGRQGDEDLRQAPGDVILHQHPDVFVQRPVQDPAACYSAAPQGQPP